MDEYFLELLSGPCVLRLAGAFRNLKGFGNLPVGHAFNGVEVEHHAVAGWQLVERFKRFFRRTWETGIVVIGVGFRFVMGIVAEHSRIARTLLELVDGRIDEDTGHPGFKGAVAAVFGNGL